MTGGCLARPSFIDHGGMATFNEIKYLGHRFLESGSQRCDTRPARPMITNAASRAWWHAVGAPLERGVRQHCLSSHGLTAGLARDLLLLLA